MPKKRQWIAPLNDPPALGVELLLTVNTGVDSLKFSIQGHATVHKLLIRIKVHQYSGQAFLEWRGKLVIKV